MKTRHRNLGVLTAFIGLAAWWCFYVPEPTVLSFHIGESFEEVARQSTYPVMTRSNLPADDPSGDMYGTIWVTEPAVIIIFNDPKHAFTLPPTKFAALTFTENKAVILSTSPMLKTLSFERAVVVLEDLQNQFKKGGWIPWEVNGSKWFDLTPVGQKRLFDRMLEPGYSQEAELRVPNKYAMTFRIKCVKGCWKRDPPYRFLIDIGVSDDTYAE